MFYLNLVKSNLLSLDSNDWMVVHITISFGKQFQNFGPRTKKLPCHCIFVNISFVKWKIIVLLIPFKMVGGGVQGKKIQFGLFKKLLYALSKAFYRIKKLPLHIYLVMSCKRWRHQWILELSGTTFLALIICFLIQK